MAVKIGHASSDENSTASGGNAGDQTAREVFIRDWYNRSKGWSTVFRAKDSRIAEKIAKAMEQACANDNIGYDQGQRTTLFEHAKKASWDISKVTAKCECDCSSLVAVCVNAAGIAINKDMYTGNQKTILNNTSKFDMLTEAKYLNKSDFLRRGDILLGQGHTAVVLSDGGGIEIKPSVKKPAKIDSAKSFVKDFAGAYKVTASALNVRAGAGTSKNILVTIPKNTTVYCFGYYTQVAGTDWLYVQLTHNGVNYTGFASAKYLVRG